MLTITKIQELEMTQVCRSLIDNSLPAEQLRPEVMQLKSLLLSFAKFKDKPELGIAENETITTSGLAISPSNAALCLEDFIRTITFIRGMHEAIDDRLKWQAHPVEVMYVGCGPLAPLVIPLMYIFAEKPVHFTLIDIHEESVSSVKSILKAFNLMDKVKDVMCLDVMTFQPRNTYHADLILTEVMQAALKSEPQVAVSCYLQQQFPDAKIIPEAVQIDLKWINPKYEFDPEILDKSQHRAGSTEIFILNKKKINDWSNEFNHQELPPSFPAGRVEITHAMNIDHQPMLFTRITVYKNHQIIEYQSGLTHPTHAEISGDIKTGQHIQFSYRLGDAPRLIGSVV